MADSRDGSMTSINGPMPEEQAKAMARLTSHWTMIPLGQDYEKIGAVSSTILRSLVDRGVVVTRHRGSFQEWRKGPNCFGSKIRDAREAKGLTVKQLAAAVQSSEAMIQRMEHGDWFPEGGAGERVCTELGLDVESMRTLAKEAEADRPQPKERGIPFGMRPDGTMPPR